MTIAAPTDRHWRLLATIVGRPELADDERFATNPARVLHAPEVYAVIEKWTAAHRTAEVVDVLGGVVPCGPVNQASDIAADPHVLARGMLARVEHPGSDMTPSVAGCPIKFIGTPAGVRSRAPLLGEHTDQILAAIGYGPERIAKLRDQRVVA